MIYHGSPPGSAGLSRTCSRADSTVQRAVLGVDAAGGFTNIISAYAEYNCTDLACSQQRPQWPSLDERQLTRRPLVYGAVLPMHILLACIAGLQPESVAATKCSTDRGAY